MPVLSCSIVLNESLFFARLHIIESQIFHTSPHLPDYVSQAKSLIYFYMHNQSLHPSAFLPVHDAELSVQPQDKSHEAADCYEAGKSSLNSDNPFPE